MPLPVNDCLSGDGWLKGFLAMFPDRQTAVVMVIEVVVQRLRVKPEAVAGAATGAAMRVVTEYEFVSTALQVRTVLAGAVLDTGWVLEQYTAVEIGNVRSVDGQAHASADSAEDIPAKKRMQVVAGESFHKTSQTVFGKRATWTGQ